MKICEMNLNEECLSFAKNESLFFEGCSQDKLEEDGLSVKYYIGYTTENNEDKVFKASKNINKLRNLVKDLLVNTDKLDTLGATALYVNSVGDDEEVFVALKDEDTNDWQVVEDEFSTYENKSLDNEYKDVLLNRVYYSLTGTFPENFKAKAPTLYDKVIKAKRGTYLADGDEAGFMFNEKGDAIIGVNIDRANKDEEKKVIDWVNKVANYFGCDLKKINDTSFKIIVPDQEKLFY